jgi:hypothetical protein
VTLLYVCMCSFWRMGPNIISLSQDLRSPRSEPRNGFLRRGMATLSTNVPDAAAPNFIVKALVPICGAVQSARGVILCIIPCRGARTIWVNSWLMVLEEVIWTDRPHLQVLAPTLPFLYHSSDDDMLMQVAHVTWGQHGYVGVERLLRIRTSAYNCSET